MSIDKTASETDVTTLSRFIMEQTKDRDLTILMNALQLSCKYINRAIRKAGICDLYGLAGTENSTGDAVKKLDLLSNEIMVNALMNCHVCCTLVSEEDEEALVVPADRRGKYVVAFDPLDGSSNIDCNVSTGTIFAVYERVSPLGSEPTDADVLRDGDGLIVAGYCMYGSATDFVVTFKNSVHRFTLDDSIGEFVYTGPVTFPEKAKTIYSCNEGNSVLWDPQMQAAVAAFKAPPKPYSARYVGSMVSDVHRTILYGGIFLYPADSKAEKGKLRILYEGFPMALITEQAGGVASTGLFQGKVQRILEVIPEHIHDRCPIIMGCERDCSKVLALYD